MGIPSDLISQLVKITNNTAKKKTESTVYGETVERDGSIYVRFDGSELLTPVSNTANVGPGERVIVLIKNHTATITGNLTSPAARVVTDPVTQKKSVENIDLDGIESISLELIEVKNLLGEKVSIGELEGEFAAIDELQADNVTINSRLTAVEADVSTLQADNADIKEKLTATEASIKDLKADNVTINGKLDANTADISKLSTDKLDATTADIKYATIENLNAEKARIEELSVNKLDAATADIKYATIENLNAEKSRIEELSVNKLDATTADIKYATIENLNAQKGLIDDLSVNKLDANSATITDLQAGLADIDTLIFGSASGTTIQTEFSNAVIAQLGNAQIKSAMIASVSAEKITAGDIITNNVRVMSEDGKMLISDETIQISDDTRVRVQIGKDAANDYSINIWDDSGNLMFSKGGITDSAIKEAIIRNDMVSETANISASKLDIDSLFEEVNGSSKTIKSSKIFIDDKSQTLDVAFTSMTSDLNGAKDDISSQGTQISAIQGQITSKVWQQDIETAVDNIEVGGRNLILGSSKPTDYGVARGISYSVHEDGYVQIVAEADNDNYVSLQYNGSDYTIAETSLTEGDEFVISFTMRSPDSAAIPDIYIKSGMGYYGMKGSMSSEWSTVWYAGKWKDANPVNFHLGFSNRPGTYEVKNIKLEKGNKATDWTPAPEDVDGAVTTLNTKYSELKQSTDGVALTVAGHTTELTNKAGKGEVTAVSDRVTSVEANLEGFKSTVSSTYTTKEDFNNLEIGGRNLFKGYSYGEEIRLPDYQGVGSFSGDMFFNRFTIDMADYVGETFTISFWAKSPNGTTGLMLYNSNGNPRYFNIERQYLDYSLGNEWKYYSITVMNLDMGEAYNPVYGCNRIEIYAPNQMGVLVKNIKLEKGNKATDWTPAPEDVEDDISGLAGRMEQAETKIDQKADSITLSAYASKTDLQNGMDAVKQWKSEHVIDLRDTSIYNENNWYPVVGTGLSSDYYRYIQVFATLDGYCRPSWCRHDSGFVVDFGVKTKAIAWGVTSGDTVILEDEYSWIKDGESSPVSYNQCREPSQPILYLRGGGRYYVRTDYECQWTPYSNGYLWQSGSYSSEWPVYDSRPTSLGNHVASDEETKASLSVLSDRITSNVTETDGLKTRMSNVEQTADRLSVSFDELEIGGRNLLLDTATTAWQLDRSDSSWLSNRDAGKVTILSDCSANAYNFFETKVSKTPSELVSNNDDIYSFSIDVKLTGTFERVYFECDVRTADHYRALVITTSDVQRNDEWLRISGTAKVQHAGEGCEHLIVCAWWTNGTAGSTIEYRLPKLEKGNKATDWTPAPEDVENDINNAAKTATNFIELTADNGLQVGNKSNGSWSGYRTQILSDAFNILDSDGMVCASYGKNLIELGKGNTSAVINMCGGVGTIKAVDQGGFSVKRFEMSSENLRLNGTEWASLWTSDFDANNRTAFKAYVETSKSYAYIGCASATDADWVGDSDALWHESSITVLDTNIRAISDGISIIGRDTVDISTVNANVYIRPANDLILDPGKHMKVRSKMFISSAEKAAYNDGVTGWYFGDDGTAHVTHVDGASISFHYCNSSETSSIIRETDYGVISINGMTFGVNKILWSGAYYMQASHTIALREAVSEQANGIVLAFSYYNGTTAQDYGWNMYFVPKSLNGARCVFVMSSDAKFGTIGAKELHVNDTTISGTDDNKATGTSSGSGITYNNNRFVLRYVIGV